MASALVAITLVTGTGIAAAIGILQLNPARRNATAKLRIIATH
jgi:hypothetical protein